MKGSGEGPGAIRIAKSVAEAGLSAIKEMALLSAQREGVISLSWGLPSFATPEPIRRAVAARLESDTEIGKYALPDGLPQLRALVAEHHRRETGVAVDPDEQVLIHAGNMEALNTLFRLLLEPGDEVILTDPGFVSHIQQVRLYGGTPIFWPLDEAAGWALDPELLPGLIGERTRAIVLVSPSNPTGAIFSEAALRRVGEIAVAHNLLIIVDDPYSAFCYENRARFFNLASVEALRDHLVYCYSFSKAYAMSGWRLAYAILPPRLKREAVKVHDATMICTPRISQVAGIAALSTPPAHLAEFQQALARRRALICERLDALAHLFDYITPQGAYYVFPRLHSEHANSRAFAIDLLERAGVAVTPGSGFGPSGEHHLRLAFCVEEEEIERAFDRIEALYGRS